ncbi:MAG: enoyl-CoA hydratase/isomerase family protein [Gammaproteobacteria bacterium]
MIDHVSRRYEWRLERAVRVSRHLLLTGELIDAQTAQQIGLVNRVVPGDQLLDAAVDCATQIALNAPQAEAKTKLLLRRFSGQAMVAAGGNICRDALSVLIRRCGLVSVNPYAWT